MDQSEASKQETDVTIVTSQATPVVALVPHDEDWLRRANIVFNILTTLRGCISTTIAAVSVVSAPFDSPY